MIKAHHPNKISARRLITAALISALPHCVTAASPSHPKTQELTSVQNHLRTACSNKNAEVISADLGGVQVNIPTHFAENIEYDGDPGWSKKISHEQPKRGKKSKIRSFGFDILYPAMTGKDSHENWMSYMRQESGNSAWIGVGINSSENYSGPNSIDRMSKNKLKRMLDPDSPYPLERYEKLPQHQHGLEVYAVRGEPYREHPNAEDVFLWRLPNGNVETYISCSNIKISTAPCRQRFSLEPYMHSDVYISYRRSMLHNWKEIQEKVRSIITNFSHNP